MNSNINTLPTDFQNCLPPNASSTYCDNVVSGYCNNPTYANTEFCACMNSKLPCAMFSDSNCANSQHAYLNTSQSQPSGSKYLECKNKPICVDTVNVSGSSDDVSGVVQQCGTMNSIKHIIKTKPTLSILTFLLFILLVIIIGSPSEKQTRKISHYETSYIMS